MPTRSESKREQSRGYDGPKFSSESQDAALSLKSLGLAGGSGVARALQMRPDALAIWNTRRLADLAQRETAAGLAAVSIRHASQEAAVSDNVAVRPVEAPHPTPINTAAAQPRPTIAETVAEYSTQLPPNWGYNEAGLVDNTQAVSSAQAAVAASLEAPTPEAMPGV